MFVKELKVALHAVILFVNPMFRFLATARITIGSILRRLQFASRGGG